jgi:hypothetical protein
MTSTSAKIVLDGNGDIDSEPEGDKDSRTDSDTDSENSTFNINQSPNALPTKKARMKRSDFLRYIQISIWSRDPMTLEDIGWLSEERNKAQRWGREQLLGFKAQWTRHWEAFLLAYREEQETDSNGSGSEGGSNESSNTNEGNHTNNGGNGDVDGNGCHQTEGNGCEDSGTA